MIKNYIKVCLRNLRKNKVFSLINIVGLSLGLTVCFVIMLYVQDELSYDRYNDNADRIVRVQFKARINGGDISEAGVMAPVAQTLQHDFPEVEAATRILPVGSPRILYGTTTFKNDEGAFADPAFFKVFTLPLIQGDMRTALAEPHTVLLSKETAGKYFGKENPLGKLLGFYNNKDLYKVTGVFDKVPANSHFHFDLLFSLTGLESARSDSWMQGSFFTYLLLKPGTNLAVLRDKLPGVVQKYMGPQIQRDMGLSLQQFRTKGNELGFVLQPLTAIHLHPTATNEWQAPGSEVYVYVFGAIAIFMLAIACINFINLSTASASKRAKEVGVRKVIGSARSQLVIQFLLESAFLVLAALIISLGLIKLSLPVFNQISGKELTFDFNFRYIAGLLGLGLIVCIAAGMYPAFFLSSFKPIAVLKGRLAGNNSSFGLRKGLVVFQFFISISLIVGTIVVYQQMRYIQNKNLGYNKEQVLVIPNSYMLGGNERAFKNAMLKDPRVVSATSSWYKPAGPSNNNNTLVFTQGHEDAVMTALAFHIDEQYIPTLGIQMAAGRNFSPDMPSDSAGMLINEAAVRALGFTVDNVVGKNIYQVNNEKGRNFPFHVVGVVKDFHFKSLHERIAPLLMTLNPEGGLIFKIQTADMAGVLASMKKEWDGFHPEEPFAYAFLDDLYNKTYAAEQKTSTILNIFSILTVIVACLGLFGLVTYTAEQRIKEIGIRKVLGASVAQITYILSIDFLKLVLVACVLAFPLSWWATHKWLESFAYRMTMQWWIFAVAAAGALLVAFATLSFKAIRAAVANPVKSLRTE